MYPDLILINGNINTLDPNNPLVTAIAISKDTISSLGSDDDIIKLANKKTEVIDLKKRLVIPGMIDAHCHFDLFSRTAQNIDLNITNKQSIISLLSKHISNSNNNKWIIGHGWDHNEWDQKLPNKYDLDSISPHNPIYLTGKSMHISWVNTAALQRANITSDTPDPPGGQIGRLESGQPNGILYETASELITSKIPEPTIDTIASNMEITQQKFWKNGITGIHDYDQLISYEAIKQLYNQNKLGLRILKNLPAQNLEEVISQRLHSGYGNKWIKIGGIKVFMDGALGARTALMLDPYNIETNNYGISVTDEEELLLISKKAGENNLSMTVHAIGDKANRAVLNVYEKLRNIEKHNGDTPDKLRHRIEHLQLLHPSDLHRLGSSKIIASMQPVHATSDMDIATKYWGKRIKHAYAWKTQINYNTVLAFGSDAPVENINPLWGIYAAVTRSKRTTDNRIKGWQTHECITIKQAIEAYTIGPAYASYSENQLGSLMPGKFADLVILDQDIYKCPNSKIHSTTVLGTLIGGRWKYLSSSIS